MKLKFVILAICLINIRCSKFEHHKYKISYEGKGRQGAIFTPQITFEGHFANDRIEFFEIKKLIDKKITTDDRVGVASEDGLTIDSISSIFFKLNEDHSVTMDSIRTYPFVYFSKDIESDTVRITYSILERKYQ